ncbi:MAG TPA: rhodanese-like domain-containing protein [Thermoanaerobaculia bacterium]|jgi:rhodanese-related sulfurtransferase
MKAISGRALRWAALLLIVPLLLAGCSRFHWRRSSRRELYKTLTPGVAYEIMRDNPGMLVLDLRPAQEYNGETGHVRGARNLPLARLPYRMLEVLAFRDETILVYCKAGNCGDQGMRVLLASGFENAILMDGGIEAWIRGGFKTVLPANLAGRRRPAEPGRPVMPVKPEDKKNNGEVDVAVPPPPPPP